jgi:hypothetical protein
MISDATKTLAWVVCISFILCTLAHAECSVNVVIVKGWVEHVPRDARVRVQLVYAKEQRGESAK